MASILFDMGMERRELKDRLKDFDNLEKNLYPEIRNLALYNQMANQETPPAAHGYCFYNCGSGTTSGAAELAQIPSDWK